MAFYFDQDKWNEAIRHKDWYLRLMDDYKALMKLVENDPSKAREIKDSVYGFFEQRLAEGKINLAEDGPDWDVERKPIDAVIIHHTKNEPGITPERLSAMHLIRLYAPYYAAPIKEEEFIKGQGIFSHHLRENKQVFFSYHWLVRMDGRAERLLKDEEIGWQAGKWAVNCRSVAICLDNNFENSSPSDTVLDAVAGLIRENYPQIKTDGVFGHLEINPKTTCPGNKFLSGWKNEILDRLG